MYYSVGWMFKSRRHMNVEFMLCAAGPGCAVGLVVMKNGPIGDSYGRCETVENYCEQERKPAFHEWLEEKLGGDFMFRRMIREGVYSDWESSTGITVKKKLVGNVDMEG